MIEQISGIPTLEQKAAIALKPLEAVQALQEAADIVLPDTAAG